MTFHLSRSHPEGQHHALPRHAAVLVAIRTGRPLAAREAMTRLIDKSERDVKRAVAARPKTQFRIGTLVERLGRST